MSNGDGMDRVAVEREHAEVVVLDVARNRRDTSHPSDRDRPVPAAGAPVVDHGGVELPAVGVDHDDDPDQPATVGMVDLPDPRPVAGLLDRMRAAERRPVVPGWVVDRGQLAATVRWAAGYAGHTAAYHGARLPLYVVRLVGRSPRGVVRLVVEGLRWVLDAESQPVRAAAVRRENAEEYLKLTRTRDAHVRWRAIVSGAAAAAAVFLAVAAADAPELVQALVAVGVVVLLGVVGTPADRPLVERAVVAARASKLTSDQVVRALASLGIAPLGKAADAGEIRFPAPITRDGPGWRADVALPEGAVAGDVIARREKLASALRRPLGCVWPEAAPSVHPGRLTIWVGDTELGKAKKAPWPLARKGSVDLFEPVPLAVDQRGRLITVTLMFASMVVGAIRRMGKTFAVRLLLLAAALDVRALLYLFDLKGTGDFGPLAPVAHRYRSGDDEEDIAYGLSSLQELHTEMRRRTRIIRELPPDVCPENKITPQLASRRDLALSPIVVAIDETQLWFQDKTHGKALAAIVEDLVRRGPAVGIVVILATQQPDADSIPTAISRMAVLRLCLKVIDWQANDQVLGTGAYKAGVNATLLARTDLGIGLLAGEAADPQIASTFFVDNPTARTIAARARAMREAAGTLSGHALGEGVEQTDAVSLLDDLLAVMPAGEDRAHSETLVERLATLRPEVYSGWQAETLATALNPLGVATRQLKLAGVNKRGVDRSQLTDAAERRSR